MAIHLHCPRSWTASLFLQVLQERAKDKPGQNSKTTALQNLAISEWKGYHGRSLPRWRCVK